MTGIKLWMSSVGSKHIITTTTTTTTTVDINKMLNSYLWFENLLLLINLFS